MNIDQQKNFTSPPESYWLTSTTDKNYPSLNQDIDVDILIIGGGFVGIACAYQLIGQGFKITLIEGNRILQEVTAHTTAKITSQHDLIYSKIENKMGKELAQQYADANQTAIQEIKRIADEHNIQCDYFLESAFAYTQQDKFIQKIHDEVTTANDLGIKASFVENIPFNLPIKGAVCFHDQAQFHPRKFTLGLAKYIDEQGVQIFENTRALDIEDGDKYLISTSQGKKIKAQKVIIASHYPFYNKHGMYFSRIYSERSYIIAIKAKEVFPGGMYISVEEPGRSLRKLGTQEGEFILVGGEHHKTGQGKPMIQHYDALVDFANSLFTVENIAYRWSTQDCMTVDGVPYVGNYTTNTPNLYLATGFQKWGMTNSIASSLLLKDLIVDGQSPWQDVYNPSRKTVAASAKNFIVENYNVAEQLLDGKLSQLPDNIDLEPGDARVLKIDGKRVGAYRDRQGNLHFVNTTCTHMGCELNWNSAEES